MYSPFSCSRVSFTLAALLSLPSIAVAKGPTVTLSDAVVGLEFAWNGARPGETVPVRVHLDIAAACSSSDMPWYPTPGVETCITADTCEAALEETRWRHGLTLLLAHDSGDFAVPMVLKGCNTPTGPGLCGDLVFPAFAPEGVWIDVMAPDQNEPLLSLGKGLLNLDSKDGDFDRPTLLAIAMPTTSVHPTAPGLEVTIEDDMSGVADIEAWFEPLGSDGKPSDGKVLSTRLRCDAPGPTGESVCRGERPLHDRGWLNAVGVEWGPVPSNGTWFLRSLRFRDRLGRTNYWEPPELARGGAQGLWKYAVSVDYAAGTVTSRTTVWTYSPNGATVEGALEEPVATEESLPTPETVPSDAAAPPRTSTRAAAGCSSASPVAIPHAWGLVALFLATLMVSRRRV